MSRFTKGPWNRGVSQRVYQGAQWDPTNKQQVIAICEPTTPTEAGWNEVWANVELIAAAPCLYEAHEPDRGGPDFLDWVADRLVSQGDNPNADFIICLRRRAEKARAALARVKP